MPVEPGRVKQVSWGMHSPRSRFQPSAFSLLHASLGLTLASHVRSLVSGATSARKDGKLLPTHAYITHLGSSPVRALAPRHGGCHGSGRGQCWRADVSHDLTLFVVVGGGGSPAGPVRLVSDPPDRGLAAALAYHGMPGIRAVDAVWPFTLPRGRPAPPLPRSPVPLPPHGPLPWVGALPGTTFLILGLLFLGLRCSPPLRSLGGRVWWAGAALSSVYHGIPKRRPPCPLCAHLDSVGGGSLLWPLAFLGTWNPVG